MSDTLTDTNPSATDAITDGPSPDGIKAAAMLLVSMGVVPAEKPKKKRVNKNATTNQIDFSNVDSVNVYLDEFYGVSFANPPTKGFDSHVNNFGWVWAGTATRMPTTGHVNICTVSIDQLVNRSLGDNKAEAAEADAALSLLEAFLKTHRHNAEVRKAMALVAAGEAAKALLESKKPLL